jgi:hypothetical protein
MNKVFEELYEKSRIGHGIDMEKFAMLIVSECANVVDENDDSTPFMTFGQLIKNHFGMEN